ncbi:MAG: (2Fe-2S)-binding protein [Chloroflexi bacterium]|nr:(2Fe-2S)-binding protein [Chloroflexota bacterium]
MSVKITGNNRRLPTARSQTINRGKSIQFTFNGKTYTAYEGDTIASALAASGVTTFSRSFKYHRRRGLLCAAGNCPNCLVHAGDEPNVRSCVTPVSEGLKVRSQNAWPSLERDVMSLTQLVDRFLPAGFYYKAFMRPRALWPYYEEILRHAAGLGEVVPATKPGEFDKVYKHADVAVVGGGPAGLRAALAAANQGANVMLLDSEPALGGHLRYATHDIGGQPAYQYAAALAAEVAAHPRIDVMTNTTAFGCYKDLWLGAVSGDRLIKLRARALVVAAGAYEIPPVFENNDLPGVMLGSAAQRLVNLWGVRPGTTAVVVSANARGLHLARELEQAGITIAAVAELRDQPEAGLITAINAPALTGAAIVRANGSRHVESIVVRAGGQERKIACDLLALSTGYLPANELMLQAGGKVAWDEALHEFLPSSVPPGIFVAGEAAGAHTLADIEREGELAGIEAALKARYGDADAQARRDTLAAQTADARSRRVAWSAAEADNAAGKRDFACYCEDVTRKDIQQSIDEGYSSIELLKRYSTVSMGPCQGKMCNTALVQLCAAHTGQTVRDTGTTTARPPVRPVTMGALGGRLMEPVRLSPMHEWHVARGAKMMNAGLWKRPEHYGDPVAEVRAVREGVALIDISTLGKIHLHGPDVPVLLERLYTNRWRKLDVGRVRYGIMVNNEGVVMDDGVTAHLSDNFYYMTATSGGAAAVYEWIESWLQTGWLLNVHALDATELRAAMNLTGPFARQVLAKVTDGVDLSNEAFPYMHAREATVAGAPALLLRVGFTGELGYEIHVPAGYGLCVWEALMDAGREFGILPFGVEAQRVLRLEKGHIIVGQDTDGLTNPLEAGLDGLVKLDKDDFIGKTSLVLAGERAVEKRLVGFTMPDGTLPEEGNQIVRPGKGPLGLEIIGRITSTRYSPTLKQVIGLCWLPAALAEPGHDFTVRVRGELKTGRVAALPFYDPDETCLRA